jgi:hypothetical protein
MSRKCQAGARFLRSLVKAWTRTPSSPPRRSVRVNSRNRQALESSSPSQPGEVGLQWGGAVFPVATSYPSMGSLLQDARLAANGHLPRLCSSIWQGDEPPATERCAEPVNGEEREQNHWNRCGSGIPGRPIQRVRQMQDLFRRVGEYRRN